MLDNNLIPLNREMVDRTGRITVPWSYYLQSLQKSVPSPTGINYVTDGSSTSYAPSTLYQGLDINKSSSPSVGDIYIAVDTGIIYLSVGGTFVPVDSPLTGDVTKPAGSSETTLKTVNYSTGEWGSSTAIPVFTVDEKGRITSVGTVPITAPAATAGGPESSVQINSGGAINGYSAFTYNAVTSRLTVPNITATTVTATTVTTANVNAGNIAVTGAISFTNPTDTVNNLLPGGTEGQVLSIVAGVKTWKTIDASEQTPYYIAADEHFIVKLYKQVLFSVPIEIDGILEVDGILVAV